MTKQEYYEHLCKIGFPDLLAASMANQSDIDVRDNSSESLKGEIYAFSIWSETIEGDDFWLAVLDCFQ